MYQLLLLGTGLVEGEKRYLYVLEMNKRKIIRVVKFDKDKVLWENWKKGMVTNVETIVPWDLEEGTFITSKDKLDSNQPILLEKVLLNTASYPENHVFCRTRNRYGLIRISDIYVEPKKHCLRARIWAWENEHIDFDVDNKRWNSFWEQSISEDTAERYSKLFNSQRRKIFAVVKIWSTKNVSSKKI